MLNDLYALVYLSKAVVDFDHTALQDLAHRAALKNEKLQISGYLCYKEGFFVQYLEGKKVHVVALYDEIEKDARHIILNMVETRDISSRKFMGWHMRYLLAHELQSFQLEDVLDWIIRGLENEKTDFLSVREHIRKMIDQIVQLRTQHLIS